MLYRRVLIRMIPAFGQRQMIPLLMPLYNGILKGRVHELLHVSYTGEKGE